MWRRLSGRWPSPFNVRFGSTTTTANSNNSNNSQQLARVALGIYTRHEVHFPNRPVPPIYILEPNDHSLIEHARKNNNSMFVHVAIDTGSFASDQQSAATRIQNNNNGWIAYDVGILLRITGVQPLPRSDHLAVTTRCLGRVRVEKPEMNTFGYWEGPIKQVVDSVPADALLRNAEETDSDYPTLKLASDNTVESLLAEIAELLQFTWYLRYQNTPHARYMEKIVRSSHDWAQHWAQAASANERVTSEVLHRRLQRLTEQTFYAADIVAAVHKLSPKRKQTLLECTDPIARLVSLRDALSSDLRKERTANASDPKSS